MIYPNLKNEMNRIGISQAKMAKEIGTPLNTLGYWLRGHGAMPLHKALEIRDRFFPRFTIEYLFQRE